MKSILFLLLLLIGISVVSCSPDTLGPLQFINQIAPSFRAAYATKNKYLILKYHDKKAFRFEFCEDKGDYNDLSNWLSSNMKFIESGDLIPGFVSRSTEVGSDYEVKYVETLVKTGDLVTRTFGTIHLKKIGPYNYKIVKATENCPKPV